MTGAAVARAPVAAGRDGRARECQARTSTMQPAHLHAITRAQTLRDAGQRRRCMHRSGREPPSAPAIMPHVFDRARSPLPVACHRLDGGGSGVLFADGCRHEAVVGQLPALAGDLVAWRGVVAVRAGVGVRHRRATRHHPGALGPASAARGAGHGDDRLLRLRAEAHAAVHRLHAVFRRAVAGGRAIGAAAGRTRRAAALDGHCHRPGRRDRGAAAGRERADLLARPDGAAGGHRLCHRRDHRELVDPYRHPAGDGGVVPAVHGDRRRPAGRPGLGAVARRARLADRRHGPGRGVGAGGAGRPLPSAWSA